MTRALLAAALVLSFNQWMGELPLHAQSAGSPGLERFVFLLPRDFSGWICIEFGVAGAAALHHEGSDVVIRPKNGNVLTTSEKPDHLPVFPEAWYEVDGERQRLPQDVFPQKQVSRTGGKNPDRQCIFFGTVDQADAAGEPPGLATPPSEKRRIPLAERQALIALYHATGGAHWIHHVGWLGPPGTECEWHGVECMPDIRGAANVTGLTLHQNNLVGVVPAAAAQLTHLKALMIFGNHLSAMLPDALIQRWLSGSLTVSAEASVLTNVSEIELEVEPPLLCGHELTTMHADGRVVLSAKRCRDQTPDDRETFCEVKEGHLWPGDFARLAWLITKGLRPEYSISVTDASYVITRVNRRSRRREVSNYASSGPLKLWGIQAAISGAAAGTEWEKTSTQPECTSFQKATNDASSRP